MGQTQSTSQGGQAGHNRSAEDWNALLEAGHYEEFAAAVGHHGKLLKRVLHVRNGDTGVHLLAQRGSSQGIASVADAYVARQEAKRGYVLPTAELKKARNKVINITNYKGRTPLMTAAKSGHVECVKYLLDQGADPTARDRAGGSSAAHYAAAAGHEEVLVVLHACVLPAGHPHYHHRHPLNLIDLPNANGFTPLHMASWHKRYKVVKALCEMGASLYSSSSWLATCDTVQCPAGSTPMHIAAMSGSSRTVKALMAAYVALMNAPPPETGHGQHQHPPTDPRLVQDLQGNLPFAVALQRHHTRLLALLHPLTPMDEIFATDNPEDRIVGVPKLIELAAQVAQQLLLKQLEQAEQDLTGVAPVKRSSGAGADAGMTSAASHPGTDDEAFGGLAVHQDGHASSINRTETSGIDSDDPSNRGRRALPPADGVQQSPEGVSSIAGPAAGAAAGGPVGQLASATTVAQSGNSQVSAAAGAGRASASTAAACGTEASADTSTAPQLTPPEPAAVLQLPAASSPARVASPAVGATRSPAAVPLSSPFAQAAPTGFETPTSGAPGAAAEGPVSPGPGLMGAPPLTRGSGSLRRHGSGTTTLTSSLSKGALSKGDLALPPSPGMAARASSGFGPQQGRVSESGPAGASGGAAVYALSKHSPGGRSMSRLNQLLLEPRGSVAGSVDGEGGSNSWLERRGAWRRKLAALPRPGAHGGIPRAPSQPGFGDGSGITDSKAQVAEGWMQRRSAWREGLVRHQKQLLATAAIPAGLNGAGDLALPALAHGFQSSPAVAENQQQHHQAVQTLRLLGLSSLITRAPSLGSIAPDPALGNQINTAIHMLRIHRLTRGVADDEQDPPAGAAGPSDAIAAAAAAADRTSAPGTAAGASTGSISLPEASTSTAPHHTSSSAISGGGHKALLQQLHSFRSVAVPAILTPSPSIPGPLSNTAGIAGGLVGSPSLASGTSAMVASLHGRPRLSLEGAVVSAGAVGAAGVGTIGGGSIARNSQGSAGGSRSVSGRPTGATGSVGGAGQDPPGSLPAVPGLQPTISSAQLTRALSTALRLERSASQAGVGSPTGRCSLEQAPGGPHTGDGPAIAQLSMQRSMMRTVQSEMGEETCGVCLDTGIFVELSCHHKLCVTCCRELVKLHATKAALCPFCRSVIKGIKSSSQASNSVA